MILTLEHFASRDAVSGRCVPTVSTLASFGSRDPIAERFGLKDGDRARFVLKTATLGRFAQWSATSGRFVLKAVIAEHPVGRHAFWGDPAEWSAAWTPAAARRLDEYLLTWRHLIRRHSAPS